MSLRSTDLNLIPVLQMLLREQSVSRTAERLGLSQPAVSAALRRLRALFDDALLVRVGIGMTLTPRAAELAAEVDATCAQLTALLAQPVFDPAGADRVFVVAALDQASFLLGPAWLRALAKEAPGARLRFTDLDENRAELLARREIDFALIPSFFVEDMPAAPLRFRPLFRDAQVGLIARSHPLAASPVLKQDDLHAYRCIGYHPGFDRIARKRTASLLGHGQFDLVADLPHAALIPFLLLESDFYGIASQRMAERLCTLLPLEWRPFEFPTEAIEVGLAWSHVQDSDPAHRWFREAIAGC